MSECERYRERVTERERERERESKRSIAGVHSSVRAVGVNCWGVAKQAAAAVWRDVRVRVPRSDRALLPRPVHSLFLGSYVWAREPLCDGVSTCTW